MQEVTGSTPVFSTRRRSSDRLLQYIPQGWITPVVETDSSFSTRPLPYEGSSYFGDMEKLLIKAVRLAAKVHAGQVDRFEQPYILHVLRVVSRGRDMEEQLLGALHDVLERSDVTLEILREKGYPEHILVALSHITRIESESYEEYIDRVAQNGLAVRVKVNDLSDKMDLRNVGQLNEADLKRYNKQMAAFERLKRLESIVRAQLTLGSKAVKAKVEAK